MTHLCVCSWIVLQGAFFGGFIDNTWARLRQRKREGGEISILSFYRLDTWGQGVTPHSSRLFSFFFLLSPAF